MTVFTASVLYELPFGKGKRYGSNWSGTANAILGHWQVDLIERATSGFPLFVVDSADESGVYFSYNGNTFQRPNEVGDPNKPGNEGGQTGCPTQIHTLQYWFNPALSPRPRPESLEQPRALQCMVPVLSTRISLSSKTFLCPSARHESAIRAEFFNLFNHAQFYMNGYG